MTPEPIAATSVARRHPSAAPPSEHHPAPARLPLDRRLEALAASIATDARLAPGEWTERLDTRQQGE